LSHCGWKVSSGRYSAPLFETASSFAHNGRWPARSIEQARWCKGERYNTAPRILRLQRDMVKNAANSPDGVVGTGNIYRFL
jgi:hypothetical protein